MPQTHLLFIAFSKKSTCSKIIQLFSALSLKVAVDTVPRLFEFAKNSPNEINPQFSEDPKKYEIPLICPVELDKFTELSQKTMFPLIYDIK